MSRNETGTADLTNGSGTASTVNVGINGASSPLKTGDTVTLIHAGTLTATGINTTANGTGMQGVTLKYNFSLATTPTNLTATVTSTGTTEGSKALSEGFLAGMTLINQGSDLAAGKGIANAIMATGGGMGFTGFGAMSGGSSRYDTGSHINVDSFALMMGLAKSGDVVRPGSPAALSSNMATAITTPTTPFRPVRCTAAATAIISAAAYSAMPNGPARGRASSMPRR